MIRTDPISLKECGQLITIARQPCLIREWNALRRDRSKRQLFYSHSARRLDSARIYNQGIYSLSRIVKSRGRDQCQIYEACLHN